MAPYLMVIQVNVYALVFMKKAHPNGFGNT